MAIGYENPIGAQEGSFETYRMLNTKILAGSFVGVNASGYALPATTSYDVVGIAEGEVNNCAGSIGATYVKVFTGYGSFHKFGPFTLTATISQTATNLLADGGLDVFLYNASMVGLASVTSAKKVGYIVPPKDVSQWSASTWDSVHLNFKPSRHWTANKV